MNRSTMCLILTLVAILAAGTAILNSAAEVEAAQYDVELKYEDSTNVKEAKGLNPVFFNYTVSHTGDVLTEEVYLQLESVPYLWQGFMLATTRQGVQTGSYNPNTPLEFLLQRGESAELTITITPALHALNGTYWMTAKVWPKKDSGQEVSHIFGVIIPQKAGVTLEVWNAPPSNEFKAIPPSTVTIRFALYNTGNGVDRYRIRGSSSRSDEGWTINFEDGIDEWGFTPNLSADPGGNNPHFIDIKVPVPAGALPNMSCQVVLNATSVFDNGHPASAAFATIIPLQYYNFQVYINGPDIKAGIPGEEVEFQLRIINLGNGMDNFTIKAIWDPELNPEFNAWANPPSIDIEANSSVTIQFIVKVPANPPKKTYFFIAEISSSSFELGPVTKTFAVEVGQYFAIALSTEEPRKTTIPGGIMDYEVTVKNTGNGLDSIVIKLSGVPEMWLTYIQPPEVSLLQAQESKIQIRVIVPSRFEEAPMGVYSLTVVAESSRSDAQASMILEMEVLQIFRIEWMYQGEAITDSELPVAHQGMIKPRRSFNPNEKNWIAITLEIGNFGNGPDNVTFAATSQEQRLTIEVTPVKTLLLWEQIKFVRVTITVLADITPGVYDLIVSAQSQDPDIATRMVPLDFEIIGVDVALPPIPTYLDPEDGPVVTATIACAPGTDLRFTLKVMNTGTLPLASVMFRGFDIYDVNGVTERWNFINLTTGPIAVGDSFVIGEGPFTEANPELVWTARTIGVHIIEFRAIVDHQSNATNDVSTVTVTVDEPPEVVITTPDLKVRKGDTLTVSGTVEDDSDDIEYVKGRIDDGEWVDAEGTTEWTLEFENVTLKEGTHTLEVVAFDGVTESPVLETPFEVKPKYKVDDSPGLGAMSTFLAIAAGALVIVGTGRNRRR